MILELHNKTQKNTGDFICNPSRYFNFPDLDSKRLNHRHEVDNKHLIIGGGGLIHKHWYHSINQLLDKNPKSTTLWGIGHNTKGIPSYTYQYYPKWIDRCNLIGIRDYIDDHKDLYLPDVSCMHPAFDKEYEITRDIVYYLRVRKCEQHQLWKDKSTLKNSTRDFNKIAKFLGSAETVVTDSYHGVYWAQLLGKNVICYSWGVKFLNLRIMPVFQKGNIREAINNISLDSVRFDPYDNKEYLEESRDLNKKFYKRFLNLLD